MSVSSFDTQMLTQIAPENILEWSPCSDYPESRIRAIYGARSSLTPLEVLDLDIPAEDRLWVVLRPEVMAERDLRLAVCDIVERVLSLYDERHPGDMRPRRAIETARRYARGEATAEELNAARDAAWSAAVVASWFAAGCTDDRADRAAMAARAAAWCAVVAAWDAIGDAGAADRYAWAAAWDAAFAWGAEADQWTHALGIVRGYLAR